MHHCCWMKTKETDFPLPGLMKWSNNVRGLDKPTEKLKLKL